MAKTTVIIALCLIALGGVAFAATGAKTSLIPAYFGVPLAICGAVGLKTEYRKHAMHIAAAIGVLGLLLPLGRLIPAMIKGTLPSIWALISLSGMAVLCGILVILAIRSFVAARANRA